MKDRGKETGYYSLLVVGLIDTKMLCLLVWSVNDHVGTPAALKIYFSVCFCPRFVGE